jgi:hypothetical protein
MCVQVEMPPNTFNRGFRRNLAEVIFWEHYLYAGAGIAPAAPPPVLPDVRSATPAGASAIIKRVGGGPAATAGAAAAVASTASTGRGDSAAAAAAAALGASGSGERTGVVKKPKAGRPKTE